VSPRLVSDVTRSHTAERGDDVMGGIPMHRGLGPHVRGDSGRIRGLGTIAAPDAARPRRQSRGRRDRLSMINRRHSGMARRARPGTYEHRWLPRVTVADVHGFRARGRCSRPGMTIVGTESH
jgi:hypothetical protein